MTVCPCMLQNGLSLGGSQPGSPFARTGGFSFCDVGKEKDAERSLQSVLKVSTEVLLPHIYLHTRDGSVSKMSTLGGHQCKTVLILGLSILVHPNKHTIKQ